MTLETIGTVCGSLAVSGVVATLLIVGALGLVILINTAANYYDRQRS